MEYRYQRIDLPFIEITGAVYSRPLQLLYFIDDERLTSISLKSLKYLMTSEPHSFDRQTEVLVEECAAFSIAAAANTGAYVDYNDCLHVVDLANFSALHRVAVEDENDSIVSVSVSPGGDKVAYLEELDRDEEMLLHYRWMLFTADSGESVPATIFGEIDIMAPDLLGWWSNDIACFAAAEQLIFWHVASNRTKSIKLPANCKVAASVFPGDNLLAMLTLRSENRLVTCRVTAARNQFQIAKLFESYLCLDIEAESGQLLVVSDAGTLRTVGTKSNEAGTICEVDREFDSAVYFARNLIVLFAENSLGVVKAL